MTIYTIYKATNKVNGKVYIGFDSAWPRRKKSHLANAHSQSSKRYRQHFHDAIKKHGKDAFEWEVVYQSWDGHHTLTVMEMHFIEQYRSYVGYPDCNGYNQTKGGEGQLGRIMSEATRLKKSASLKGRTTSQSKQVYTPHGTFESVTSTATHLSLHVRTVYERIKRHPEWGYVGDVESKIVAVRTGYSKEITTPYGTFISTRSCSASTGIPLSTIESRLTSAGWPEWQYTGNVVKQGTRSVDTPHGTFSSIADAARQLSMSKSTIAARIRSPHHPEWRYTPHVPHWFL